jgi:PAS domain S-box-containing protein
VSGLDVPLERDAFLRILIRELAGTLIRCAEKLRESRQWCRALVQNASDVITVLEADGTVRHTSPALERVLGYRPEEQAGNRVFSLVHPDGVERALATLAEVLETPGVHPPIEFRVLHADGSWRYLEHTLNNLLDDPSVRGIVVNSRDVTERGRAEEKLQESERSLAATQRIARLGNWDYSPEHNRAYWSDELYRTFGFAPQEFAPTYRTFMRSVHPDDKRLVRRAIRKACYEREHYDHNIEYRIVRPDGEIRTVYTQYEVICGETSRPTRVAGTVQDITERKSLEDRLHYQALHDPLTDLPNRTLFIDRLEHALARSRRSKGRVAVLFIDLEDVRRYLRRPVSEKPARELPATPPMDLSAADSD